MINKIFVLNIIFNNKNEITKYFFNCFNFDAMIYIDIGTKI